MSMELHLGYGTRGFTHRLGQSMGIRRGGPAAPSGLDRRAWRRRLSRRALLRAAGLSIAAVARTRLTPPPVFAGSSSLTLTFQPGSSAKIEQVIGDDDYAALAQGIVVPTTSQTISQCNVAGCDLGASFEHQGRLLFLFGDTISNDPSMPWSTSTAPLVNYRAADCMGWSTSTDPESGLLLTLYTNADGSPLFVQPPGVPMGAFDTPNAGIDLNGRILIVCNSGSDTAAADPHARDYSVLARFDETAQTFTTGRTISSLPGGHFVIVSLHEIQGQAGGPSQVLIFGLGNYRATDVYLATTPSATFESGAGTAYFAGLSNGQPLWTSSEAAAAPVVQDVVTPPTIGNVSVIYASQLARWLMTFDGGGGNPDTNGIYFSHAAAPWGPWSAPQLIFNPVRDHGVGDFINNYDARSPNSPGTPAGPTIGGNDIYRTRGGNYAPYMIERFTTVSANTLTIYYLMSTWNPYTPVKMRSRFAIAG
jgi:hypothetical protein